MASANDSVNGNWNYAYDDFNRLCAANQGGQSPLTCTSANTTGQVAYTYAYDRFGNRWKQTLTAGSGGTSSVTFSGNNNRIDGYSYDAAGNLLSDGVHTYAYDAENRIISVDSGAATYVYDAGGQRVRKTVGGASTDYLYDLAGHAITEVNASGWQRGEVYAGGRHVATYVNGTTYFAHMDWLGTERVHTAVSGAVCETVTSLPFGDGEATAGSCDPSTRHFTGKMRDAETNLDNFEARYYSSALGRFMIPDWDAKATAVPYAAYGNPQTLNLYGYVGNNPITDTDATGHAGESPSFPISQAEPLDVTGQDNAHWEPQLDIDPELKGGSIIPMFVDEDVSSSDPTTVVLFAAGISLSAVGNTQAPNQTTSPKQQLTYATLSGGPKSTSWVITWQLAKASEAGGWIVQEITEKDKSGKTVRTFWEAWQVPAKSKSTVYGVHGDFRDDTFQGTQTGNTVSAQARFYEGLKLPSSFIPNNPATVAGILRSTTRDPNLPTQNATSAVNRRWTEP